MNNMANSKNAIDVIDLDAESIGSAVDIPSDNE